MSTIGSSAPAILPAPKFIPHAVQDSSESSVAFNQQSANVAQSAATRAAGQLAHDARSEAPAVTLSADAHAIAAKQATAELAQSKVQQAQSASVSLDFTV